MFDRVFFVSAYLEAACMFSGEDDNNAFREITYVIRICSSRWSLLKDFGCAMAEETNTRTGLCP